MTVTPRPPFGSFRPQPGLSRRNFLVHAAAAGALPLLGASALARPLAGALLRLPAGHGDVLRVGLIGAGGRGTGAAAQCLSTEPGSVVLTAVADVFPERIERSLATLRRNFGESAAQRVQVPPEQCFAGFDGARRVIESDVHIVLLAAPPSFRPAHLAAAVAAGKHVFAEKPMAVDPTGVRSVLESVERARAARLSLVAGFCWRYNVRHRELYTRIADGAVGDIRCVYSTYNATPLGTAPRQPGWTELEFQMRNWQHFTWLSGDHIVEQACHSLDKQAWAFGDTPPLSATAVGGNAARDYPERGDAFDHFGVTYDYPDGAKAFHMCRQIERTSHSNDDWVWGTRGDARIEGWTPRHLITGPAAWEYEGDGNDMYQAELDELVGSIRRGEPLNDGVWMARSTLLAIMGRLAATTGQTVTWEQALQSRQALGPQDGLTWDTPAPAVELPVPGRTQLI